MSWQAYLRRASSADLYRYALEALRVAPSRDVAGFDPSVTVRSLRDITDALDVALRSTGAELLAHGRAGGLTAVDGPFAGDVTAATATSKLWLDRAGAILAVGATRAVNNAHIATGGLVRVTSRFST